MEKKAQPSALKNYQDFAKQYKEEFSKLRGSKPLDIQIKDAYAIRKVHENWENFSTSQMLYYNVHYYYCSVVISLVPNNHKFFQSRLSYQ